MIEERLARVRERVARAARKAGRDPDEITIVAVSKLKPAEDIVAAYQAGQRHFGENYLQEFQRKRADLPPLPGAVFHMIGRLQSNKTKAASGLFDIIQTVHGEKIARRLNDAGRDLGVFLEVKLSEEESKSGLAEADIGAVKQLTEACSHLRLRGLMGMPPWFEDPEKTRPYFQRLRQLADRYGVAEISMGMSRDLETAIQEGSTMVRVGTAIFGKRPPR